MGTEVARQVEQVSEWAEKCNQSRAIGQVEWGHLLSNNRSETVGARISKIYPQMVPDAEGSRRRSEHENKGMLEQTQ